MYHGFHHLHARKRIYKNLETFPSRSLLKRLFDYIMYAAAIAAPLALLPQVIELYSTKDAGVLSLPTWALLGLLNCLWLFYGILHREPPIIITNIALAAINFIIVAGILLY